MKNDEFLLDNAQLERFIEVLKMLKRMGYLKSLRQIMVENGKNTTYLADCLNKNVQISAQFVKTVAHKYPMINMKYVRENVGSTVLEPVAPEDEEQQSVADEPVVHLDMPDHTNHLVTKENMERMQRELNELREQFAVLRYRMELMEKEK